MIDLYLTSAMDRNTWLRRSLEGSLPGLKVWGPVLEGRASVEGRRYDVDMTVMRGHLTDERYQTEVDYDSVLRGHFGKK